MSRIRRFSPRSLPMILAGAALGVSSLSAQVPDWIASDQSAEPGIPLWIAADRAVVDGELRWELFSPDARKLLSMMVEGSREAAASRVEPRSDESCTSFLSTPGVVADEGWTAATVYQRSSAVYFGSVTDVEQGFLGGRPGTMLELAVEEVIKGSDPLESSILIFYPAARIPLRGVELCSKTARGDFDPRVGLHLVYARAEEGSDYDPRVFIASDLELFVEAPDGGLSLPHGLSDLAVDVGELATRLRNEALREGGG